MTAISPDGRPPQLEVVRREWKWFVVVGTPLGLVGIAVLIMILGPTAGILATLLVIGAIVMTVPVWGAALMRGREERAARRAAQRLLGVGPPRTPNS